MSLRNYFPHHTQLAAISKHTVPTSTASYLISLLTRSVGWAVEVSRGAAIFRPIHEVGWLIHVLSKENGGAISRVWFWGLADRPGKAAFEGQSCQDTHQACAELSCWQGATQGQGGTYDPEAIKGHVGIEVLQVLQPPLVCVWVGEVCEGSETRPDLWGQHKCTGSASR